MRIFNLLADKLVLLSLSALDAVLFVGMIASL
jgi:hypothetical protein